MNISYRLIAPALLAGALALPGAAMAQNNGGNNNGPVGPVPSQRIVNTQPNGQGAALVIAPSGVREVQQALNRLGYSAGPITGTWNKRTQNAMQSFQGAHGLSPNGDLTLSAISALGLWGNLIGNPNGNGNQPLVAQNGGGGSPPQRGMNGGNGGQGGPNGPGGQNGPSGANGH